MRTKSSRVSLFDSRSNLFFGLLTMDTAVVFNIVNSNEFGDLWTQAHTIPRCLVNVIYGLAYLYWLQVYSNSWKIDIEQQESRLTCCNVTVLDLYLAHFPGAQKALHCMGGGGWGGLTSSLPLLSTQLGDAMAAILYQKAQNTLTSTHTNLHSTHYSQCILGVSPKS